MKNKTLYWLIPAIFFGVLGLINLIGLLCYLAFYQKEFIWGGIIDIDKASRVSIILNGFVGLMWSFAGVLLIYGTFQVQNRETKLRHFDTLLFQMFNQLNNIIENTKGKVYRRWIENDPEAAPNEKVEIESSGLEYFSNIHRRFTSLDDDPVFMRKAEHAFPKPADREEIVNGELRVKKNYTVFEYEFVFDLHHSRLGHFYRYLYNIFKFIIQADLSESEKAKYINLIQAQLSDDILSLIFYNALSKYGKDSKGEDTFYQWLDEYSFFENVKKNSLRHEYDHWLYPNTIFKFFTDEEKKEKREKRKEKREKRND